MTTIVNDDDDDGGMLLSVYVEMVDAVAMAMTSMVLMLKPPWPKAERVWKTLLKAIWGCYFGSKAPRFPFTQKQLNRNRTTPCRAL